MDIVLGILGETVLRVGQSLDTEWGRPKERAVLAALATQPGKSMSVDALRRVCCVVALCGNLAGLPARADENSSPSQEIMLWYTIQGSRDAEDFRAYLNQFPGGAFVELAASWRTPPIGTPLS